MSIRGDGLWAASLGSLLATCLVVEAASSFNHDLAFILVGAGRLLDGGSFGVDVIDPNPPLAWWLAIIPVGIARLTSLSPELAAIGFTVALIAVAVSFVWRFAGPVPATSAAAILAFMPGYDFGQREQWMAALALPWLLLAAATEREKPYPVWLRILAGMLGGIAFCLKPYFVLVPLIVEAWVQARQRSLRLLFRAENCALAAISLLYAAAIVALCPRYLDDVVPYALHAYWAFDNDLRRVVLAFAANLLLYAIGLALLLREAKSVPPEAKVLGLAAAGAFAAALLQMKGWSYHWLPVKAFAGLGCLALCLAIKPSPGRRAMLWIAMVPVVAATFGDTAVGFRARGNAQYEVSRVAATLRKEARPGTAVYAFVTSPRTILPAVLAAGDEWDSAACCVQWIPADVRSGELPPERAVQTREAAAERFELLMRELEARPPGIILIDRRPDKLGFDGMRFDYLSYLRRNSRFNRFFASYEERPAVAAYRVFVRRRN